jgi:hypothetical protein
MKAICMPDYLMRLALVENVNMEEMQRRESSDNYNSCLGSVIALRSSLIERNAVRKVGYFDAEGVLFSGKITRVITEFSREVFDVSLKIKMHAYIDMNPGQIRNGVHDVSVYGHACRLYLWSKGDEVRGHIVLKSSKADNAAVSLCLGGARMRPWGRLSNVFY